MGLAMLGVGATVPEYGAGAQKESCEALPKLALRSRAVCLDMGVVTG